jgi:hypothetical protein
MPAGRVRYRRLDGVRIGCRGTPARPNVGGRRAGTQQSRQAPLAAIQEARTLQCEMAAPNAESGRTPEFTEAFASREAAG